MRVLILGATGMLGSTLLRLFHVHPGIEVFGTVRSPSARELLPHEVHAQLVIGVDVENNEHLLRLMARVRPDAVVNCIGLVKQLSESELPLAAIPINALLPHRLAEICGLFGARLIHISTDCVFSGRKGLYTETDFADADDLYGRSKYLGEVDYPHAVTLRTSIIGHELNGSRSLVCWFLAQHGQVSGFRRATFSGLPTVELGRVILEHVLPNTDLHGLYHVSAEPINKFDLLALIAQHYGKNINIIPEDDFFIDRSLDSSRFRQATGFQPKAWDQLVQSMKEFG
ncbi:dTDP-4-dehydrorhamnose reductase [Crenobacter luteus]|uniref:dTDP-4-dehydrorhamnose reductase family protein n=1 Tax=Crenobacter luteus TaxID=1452487 RepID=UPI001046B83F|nr:SDR family oxidoreductase [Crenobacter luteus]TCP10541.1 dTDP-4-dehydrorhamnose reductase [Crenobacter luteus]